MTFESKSTFQARKGTNISHWLSQSSARGERRRNFFTRDDVARIASLGFDHIRLPIDEEQMWKEDGSREPEAFELLDSALDWAAAEGLNVVLDLHILRSHYFNDRNEPRLYTDPAELERFVKLWLDLSSHLHDHPVDRLAYEFLNEAVARDPQRWNAVSGAVHAALRNAEPERWFVLGSNSFNSVFTYKHLRVPDDDRLILTFHYYQPMLVTHHQAKWWSGGAYEGPVQYPGKPIPEDVFASLDDETRKLLEPQQTEFDRDRMREEISLPVIVARKHGRPLYCGEFGCYVKTPADARAAWYRDLLAVLDEFDIGWANWDYKGGFGLDGVVPIEKRAET